MQLLLNRITKSLILKFSNYKITILIIFMEKQYYIQTYKYVINV